MAETAVRKQYLFLLLRSILTVVHFGSRSILAVTAVINCNVFFAFDQCLARQKIILKKKVKQFLHLNFAERFVSNDYFSKILTKK